MIALGLIIVYSGQPEDTSYGSDERAELCAIHYQAEICDSEYPYMNFYGGQNAWEQIENGTYDWSE
jgi:hypothetical protein